MRLLSSDNELYASFYDLVGMGARRPEDSVIELQRSITDDILFPHYRDKIRFAALSLDGRGATRWGECSLVLREMPIEDRTTVFEENSVNFARKRKLGVEKPTVPPGYRAVWERRDQLAAAKLEHALQPGMQPQAFAGVMLKEGSSSVDDDFVEVHIYGSLHRKNVARMTIRKPKRKADGAILKQLEADLREIGATIETYE
jgi:hypothetical protein